VGNLIFQLKAAGCINNVQEGRILCHNSYETREYEPCDKEKWLDRYESFLKVWKK
jgi:hypothetical protein